MWTQPNTLNVEINYEYEISKYPVKRDLCDKLIADGCNIA